MLLQLLDNVVALFDVQLGPVLTALLVKLLHEELVLVGLLRKLGDLAQILLAAGSERVQGLLHLELLLLVLVYLGFRLEH